MFEKFSNIIEGKFAGPLEKLSNQRHLRAIRDGIIATLPIIIVSSLLMVVAFSYNQMPESWALAKFIKANAVAILLPYRMSMYIMTLYAVFGIGYSLAKSYDLDGLSGAIMAELTFLLTIVPVSIPDVTDSITALASKNAELNAFLQQLPSGYVIPAENLGSAGMFIGILSAFIGVEIYRFTQVKGIKITMPAAVPPAVARSFESLTPTIIIILGMSTITMWLGIDVHSIVGTLIKPLVNATDTLPSTLIIIFLIMFFWSFGIHGDSIVSSLARPIWLILLDQNTAAVAAGKVATHIGVEPFLQWFVHIGGSGATLGLAILFCFKAKSKYGKTLGRTTILPSIFNINEPMIFGAPIVLNPMLLIPFIVIPLVLATIAWVATAMHLVNCAVTIAPWTLPGPIGAYLACGGDWRAAVLNIILIVISVVLYYPFFKMYDKELLEEEKAKEGKAKKEDQVIAKAIENATMEIPELMIKTQARQQMDNFAQNLMSQGLTMEQYAQFTGMTADKMMEQMLPSAEKNIKTRLVLEAIAKAENIEISDEKIDEKLAEMAKSYDMEVEKLKELVGEAEKQQMKDDMAVQEAIDFLVENAVEK